MTRFMREQGYVVLRAVANASELAHARELLWAFLEVSLPRTLSLALNLALTLTLALSLTLTSGPSSRVRASASRATGPGPRLYPSP